MVPGKATESQFATDPKPSFSFSGILAFCKESHNSRGWASNYTRNINTLRSYQVWKEKTWPKSNPNLPPTGAEEEQRESSSWTTYVCPALSCLRPIPSGHRNTSSDQGINRAGFGLFLWCAWRFLCAAMALPYGHVHKCWRQQGKAHSAGGQRAGGHPTHGRGGAVCVGWGPFRVPSHPALLWFCDSDFLKGMKSSWCLLLMLLNMW